jgi:mRNA-degrading endonuclease RelE of RelBE toxin-antitoxin system
MFEIEAQLASEPITEMRNRKKLGENELSDWELRIDKYRVFYDEVIERDISIVQIKAVGHKEHNKLDVSGREVQR